MRWRGGLVLAVTGFMSLGCGKESRSFGSVETWLSTFTAYCNSPVREEPFSGFGPTWQCEPAALPPGCQVVSSVTPVLGSDRTRFKGVDLLFSNCPVPDFLRAVELLVAPLVPASKRAEFLERVLAQLDRTLKSSADWTSLASWTLGDLKISAQASHPAKLEGVTISRASASLSVVIRD